ncbi:MAG: PilZ domain-containing protein [Candidatus Omnitrophota bacterium]|nr:PilZ domain-containing protein [Candidatus Omnitrophota bacterium]
MSVNYDNNERRKYSRVIKSLPLKITGEDFDIVTETKNLSPSGAYCQVSKYLEPLTKLKIILLLPFKRKEKTITKKISCQGVVIRTDNIPLKKDYYNIAIYFNDIQKKDLHKISDYITSFIKK